MKRGATFSTDGVYRYTLTRTWDEARPVLAVIMLNPSTADAEQDDPTIRRVIAFAKSWGFGGVVILNLFAFRSTKPRPLYTHYDESDTPAARARDAHELQNIIAETQGRRILAAWGSHGHFCGKWGGGAMMPRSQWVLDALPGRLIERLGPVTGETGEPGHPLYLPASTRLEVHRPGTAPPMPTPYPTTGNLFPAR